MGIVNNLVQMRALDDCKPVGAVRPIVNQPIRLWPAIGAQTSRQQP